MNRIARLGLAVGLGALVATVGYAIDASGSEHDALGPGVVRVEVGIENSRFDLGPLRVWEGTLVEFVVQNDDPIDHELVVATGFALFTLGRTFIGATPPARSGGTHPCRVR